MEKTGFSLATNMFAPKTNSRNSWGGDILNRVDPWIQDCTENHQNCRCTPWSISNEPPTRLIDVGPPDGSRDPYLFIPPNSTRLQGDAQSEESTVNLRYIALSYCWGTSENFRTTTSTLTERIENIPWDGIPETIKDAILITRRLGVRYLWVDALCIIQDSGDDWKVESSRMKDVYGGAFLTISAALSPNVHHGISRQTILVQPGNAGPGRSFALQADPLYSRAWALQERLLSRRLLIFGSDQIYWECQSSQDSEDGILPSRVISLRLPSRLSSVDWEHIVRDYTCRSLTCGSDKLPALSGLAQVYHQATQHDYIAGLWIQTLIPGLLWRLKHLLFGKKVKTARSSIYRAPSWSWASMDGNITHIQLVPGSFKPRATLLHSVIELAGDDTFGQVRGSWIELQGPFIHATLKGAGLFGSPESQNAFALPDIDSAPDDFHSADEDTVAIKISDVWCLLLAESYGDAYGLVLAKTYAASSDSEVDKYERIGIFCATEKPGWIPWFGGAEEKTVVII
jgi:hypothetical protein